jgi:hypothetical protein
VVVDCRVVELLAGGLDVLDARPDRRLDLGLDLRPELGIVDQRRVELGLERLADAGGPALEVDLLVGGGERLAGGLDVGDDALGVGEDLLDVGPLREDGGGVAGRQDGEDALHLGPQVREPRAQVGRVHHQRADAGERRLDDGLEVGVGRRRRLLEQVAADGVRVFRGADRGIRHIVAGIGQDDLQVGRESRYRRDQGFARLAELRIEAA